MLKVYNTLTREKEIFKPLHPPFVGMYVCGPTVYDDPHLGHGKTYVSFDVIVRYLRASGYQVRYVQNITDVGHLLGDTDEGEDRILTRAKIERLEPVEVAQKYENHFFRDMDRLNCLRPDISCRATGHIPEMIELVEKLIQKGYGYENKGNVYFDVSKFKDYGKLSGKKIEDLKQGVRVKVAPGKKNSLDFSLWKKAEPEHLMQWSSPWGRGFPGWHLECSVMSMKYLGESFDIHGGGLDNQFPHHDCEIAQSEAAYGKIFAKYWLHNNMLTLEGQKMSKSLGNFVTLEMLFQKYHPMVVRFFILQSHYRSPQDFSDKALKAAQTGYERLINAVSLVRQSVAKDRIQDQKLKDPWLVYRNRFFEFMNDDFNTSGGISVIFELVKRTNEILLQSPKSDELQSIEYLFTHLGEEILGFQFEGLNQNGENELESTLIDFMVEMRQRFRDKQDWQTADEIRDGLKALGIQLEDGKEGVRWKKVT